MLNTDTDIADTRYHTEYGQCLVLKIITAVKGTLPLILEILPPDSNTLTASLSHSEGALEVLLQRL